MVAFNFPILIASIMRPVGETGVQTHMQSVKCYLERKGIAVELVTPFDYPKTILYPLFGMRKIIHPLSHEASVGWYRQGHSMVLKKILTKKLSEGQPCLVYAQCPLSARAALQARVNSSQKIVLVVHFNESQADEWVGKGMLRHGSVLYRNIMRIEKEMLLSVDGVIFVSDYMRRLLINKIPALGSRSSVVIPNHLPDRPGDADIKYTPHSLISIGTLEPRKNQAYLLDILDYASNRINNLSLTIIGDGPDRAQLEKKARSLGLSKQVRFLGHQNDAASMMPGHACYVHAAKMENLSIVLLEALRAGLPIFAPPVGGNPEILGNGVQPGYLWPLNSSEKASSQLCGLLNDNTRLKQARGNARQRFLETYEESKVAPQLLDYFISVSLSESSYLPP